MLYPLGSMYGIFTYIKIKNINMNPLGIQTNSLCFVVFSRGDVGWTSVSSSCTFKVPKNASGHGAHYGRLWTGRRVFSFAWISGPPLSTNCARVESKLLILGISSSHLFIGNPFNWFIKPYEIRLMSLSLCFRKMQREFRSDRTFS